ncbi:MAG TPA: hypothetical protein VKF42_05615 [Chitinivibrionales bacterium]|jgi:hypothetical protein|nr:hypothetical protein [Chitinivibrionales bacterium]
MKNKRMLVLFVVAAVMTLCTLALGAQPSGIGGLRGFGISDGTIHLGSSNAETEAWADVDSTKAMEEGLSGRTETKDVHVSVVGASSRPYSVRPIADGIRFHSEIRENLIVSLTSVSGKTIAILFRGIVEPSISYDLLVQDRQARTGIYLCSIRSAKKTVSVKLVLTK